MSNQTKKPAPKKAASPAQKPAAYQDSLYMNPLQLDAELLAELKAKRLFPKWINANKFKQDGFVHRTGFKPYKRETQPTELEAIFGSDPSGFIRRRDSILAVKPIEHVQEYRRVVAERAARQEDPMKVAAKQIRQAHAEAGLDNVRVEVKDFAEEDWDSDS